MSEFFHHPALELVDSALHEARLARQGSGQWEKVRNYIRRARKMVGGRELVHISREPGTTERIDLDAVIQHLATARQTLVSWDGSAGTDDTEWVIQVRTAIRLARMALPSRERQGREFRNVAPTSARFEEPADEVEDPGSGPPESAPDGSQYAIHGIEEEPPGHSTPVSGPPSVHATAGRISEAQREETERRKRAIGRHGEEFVLGLERRFLEERGRGDLAVKIRHVAFEDGDGAGYDILSYDEAGNEKFIEVKTTSGGKSNPFMLSERERATAERLGSSYWLYRVFGLYKSPRLYRIQGSLTEKLLLEPTEYVARVKAY